MPIPIFFYDRYQLKTDTNISINADAYTDRVLADTDMIKTDTDISVSVSVLAENIGQPIYRSISKINLATNLKIFYSLFSLFTYHFIDFLLFIRTLVLF